MPKRHIAGSSDRGRSGATRAGASGPGQLTGPEQTSRRKITS